MKRITERPAWRGEDRPPEPAKDDAMRYQVTITIPKQPLPSKLTLHLPHGGDGTNVYNPDSTWSVDQAGALTRHLGRCHALRDGFTAPTDIILACKVPTSADPSGYVQGIKLYEMFAPSRLVNGSGEGWIDPTWMMNGATEYMNIEWVLTDSSILG